MALARLRRSLADRVGLGPAAKTSPGAAAVCNALSLATSCAFFASASSPAAVSWVFLAAGVGEDRCRGAIKAFLLVKTAAVVVGGAFFAALGVLRLPAVEAYRVRGNVRQEAWPRRAGELAAVAAAALVDAAFELFFFGLSMLLLACTSADSDPATVPWWPVALAQVVAMSAVYDAGFYAGHRLLHTPKLYSFHKLHHSPRPTLATHSLYFHPVDNVLSNIVPYTLSVAVVGPHMHTALLWTVVLTLYGMCDHSSYDFPYCPLALLPRAFTNPTRHHYFHHSHNSGNFGSAFGVLDALLGTDAGYWRFYAEKKVEG